MIRSLVTSLALCVAVVGVHAQQEPQILGRGDIRSLNRAAQDWFEAYIEYQMETDVELQVRRGKVMRRAKNEFLETWESKQRKGNVLASVPDLRAVFENTFPYDRVSTSGEPKHIAADENDPLVPEHVVVAPRRYNPREAIRTVLVLTSFDREAAQWARPSDHYAATWEESEFADETLVAMPVLDPSVDLNSVIAADQPNAEDIERERARLVLGTARGVSSTYRADRDRIFLDVGRGAGAFALRYATYNPTFFAGLIIREPVDVTDEIRLGSLKGLPVLLVSDEQTKEACEALEEVLNALEPGSCTVIEGQGEHPFTESQADIDAWIEDKRRELNKPHILVEPNHDVLNDVCWVQIGTADPLADHPRDQQPRLEVKADKEANRIDVSARNVEDFRLLLNDELVDLDEPFTVVINGQAFEQTRQRSLDDMVERILDRRDPGFLFTAEFGARVPRTDGGER